MLLRQRRAPESGRAIRRGTGAFSVWQQGARRASQARALPASPRLPRAGAKNVRRAERSVPQERSLAPNPPPLKEIMKSKLALPFLLSLVAPWLVSRTGHAQSAPSGGAAPGGGTPSGAAPG